MPLNIQQKPLIIGLSRLFFFMVKYSSVFGHHQRHIFSRYNKFWKVFRQRVGFFVTKKDLKYYSDTKSCLEISSFLWKKICILCGWSKRVSDPLNTKKNFGKSNPTLLQLGVGWFAMQNSLLLQFYNRLLTMWGRIWTALQRQTCFDTFRISKFWNFWSTY